MILNQNLVRRNSVLQDVTERIGSSVRVLHVEHNRLLQYTYIIESPSALRILLEPWAVGSRLANLARSSTIDFLRVAYQLCPELARSTFETVVEIVPLAGSLYYSLAEAFEEVFGETINRCFIGARRHLTTTGWVTELSYENFEAMPHDPVLLIGDTIATGSTIERIVNSSIDHSSSIRAIVIYSIAGGLVGAVRIREMAQRINIPTYLFYSNAIFGVEPNGTDMPWLHPGTIATIENQAKARAVYGPDLGCRWCSIWDWGDRAKNPLKHLEELLERCKTELKQTESRSTKRILTTICQRTESSIASWKQPIKNVFSPTY
ncbi:MAG: hypothetical protein EAX81_07010 [Candidatus Thorarchaeota archaeon]|nr:hypothetical protein [Candidatus Thorarchaeota archaeon]